MFTHFIRTFGANAYLIENHISDRYTKVTNNVGIATITVPVDHPAVTGLALDDQIEIYRGNLYPTFRVDHVMDWRGLYRGYTLRTLADGREVADLFAFHENEILNRAINAYWAGIIGTTKYTGVATYTIMQNLINDNFNSVLFSSVGSYIRGMQATSRGVVIGAMGLGSTASGDFETSQKNVLSILQELADLDGSVFTLTKTSSTAANWQFYVYPLTFATDRRATAIFEVRRENAANLELDLRVVGNFTRVNVGGQGEGGGRQYWAVASADHNLLTNHYETFLDARNLETVDALIAAGATYLKRTEARPILQFRPVQQPTMAYGKNYFWGDIATLHHAGTNYVQRIMNVAVTYDGNGETIQLGLEDLP